MGSLATLLSPAGFMPHGHCFLWTPPLLWTYVLSDSLIGLAYYSIPVALWWFVRRRVDLPFNWMFVMFAVFIFACGTTHLMAIWKHLAARLLARCWYQGGYGDRLAGHCLVTLALDA
jgi:hypothetical protein